MSKRSNLWLAAVAGLLLARFLLALVLPRSFQLTAFSDIVQCILLASGTAAFIPLALRSQGRMRLFWSLITLGISFWFIYQTALDLLRGNPASSMSRTCLPATLSSSCTSFR